MVEGGHFTGYEMTPPAVCNQISTVKRLITQSFVLGLEKPHTFHEWVYITIMYHESILTFPFDHEAISE